MTEETMNYDLEITITRHPGLFTRWFWHSILIDKDGAIVFDKMGYALTRSRAAWKASAAVDDIGEFDITNVTYEDLDGDA